MRGLFVALCALAMMSPAAAQADEHGISVSDAYAYATAPAQKNGAAFMTIYNKTMQDDQIVSAYADIAERTELHTHIMDGDKMMMREVDHYELPSGGQTTLQPMGHHVMFMGLKAPLKEGESFPLTVSFEYNDPMIVEVHVVKPGAGHGHKAGGHHGMH